MITESQKAPPRVPFGPIRAPSVLAMCIALLAPVAADSATDDAWPMYRYDAARSASSPYELAEELHLHWVRELPEPRRAWPWQRDDLEKLAFDKSYEPVAANGMLYVASMVEDTVTAYCAETGEKRWRYNTDGPVRMAPLVWEGRVYAAADDGYLHCIDAESGDTVWKFRAAPTKRAVLGNERIISLWPARGGPVVQDGVLYFAAGLWPHEGIYIYALHAETGDIEWVNSGDANQLVVDSKRYYSFGGVVPQGQLSVQGDRLFVPGGRTVPAAFDRRSGDLLYYNIVNHAVGKAAGGHAVFVHGDWYFNVRDYTMTSMFSVLDGAHYGSVNVDLTTEQAFIGVNPANGRVEAFSSELEMTEEPPQPEFDRRGRPVPEEYFDASRRAPHVVDRLSRYVLSDYYELNELWRSESVEGLRRLHFKAGATLYGSGEDGMIAALRAPENGEPAELLWTDSVDGEIFSMIAAHGRLYVSTVEGKIYCFGPEERETVLHAYAPEPLDNDEDDWTQLAERILAEVDPRGGYGFMFGAGSGRLLEELLEQSYLRLTVFEPDPGKVSELRERFIEAGLYGGRVSVHQGDVHTWRLPPYVASLIVSEDPEGAGIDGGAKFAETVFHALRPYGGVAALPLTGDAGDAFAEAVESAALENASFAQHDEHVLLGRPGPLPGAGSWTHQHADAGNTAFSPDKRVKSPLGVAWFGGPSNEKSLPHHMFGPNPQVVAGRLFLMGSHHVSARCVYTGVELWAKELPGVAKSFTDFEYDETLAPTTYPSQPGANYIGSPLASAEDSVYVLYQDECLRLEAATGELLDTFEMPAWDDLKQHGRDPFTQEMRVSYGARLQEGAPLRWGHVRYKDDVLIAAAYPHMFDDGLPGRAETWNATSSEFVVAMDRRTGEIKWVHQARYGFRHNAIVAGNGRVYVVDHLSDNLRELLGRRGLEPEIEPQIHALDIDTGEVLWTYMGEVFGTMLAYSEPHDVLVQSGHLRRREPLPDEPSNRLSVLRGETGDLLWAESLRQRRAPVGLHGTLGYIIGSTHEGARNMLTGEPRRGVHPMTGEDQEWEWAGALRCGTQNYSEHLVKFRSGTAAVADVLPGRAMTATITGFRPGCTNNLIAADGVLNAPEYTRGCSCAYQHQTNVGLVHMPEVEAWAYSPHLDPAPGTVKRAGVNFGAPGSRFDERREVLWAEYPAIVGPTPRISKEIQTSSAEPWFRHHATIIEEENDGLAWVGASGMCGAATITLKDFVNQSNPGSEPTYTVRLHFAEPDHDVEAGQRVFNVILQGDIALVDYDIVAETGGVRRIAVAEFDGVVLSPDGRLTVDIAPADDSALEPVICGVEVVLNE